jgi:hypothetical protein
MAHELGFISANNCIAGRILVQKVDQGSLITLVKKTAWIVSFRDRDGSVQSIMSVQL